MIRYLERLSPSIYELLCRRMNRTSNAKMERYKGLESPRRAPRFGLKYWCSHDLLLPVDFVPWILNF